MPKHNDEQIRLEKICKVLKEFTPAHWKPDERDYNYYILTNRLKFSMTGTFADAGDDNFQVEDISLYVVDDETGKVIESYENVRPPYLFDVFETLAKQEGENKKIDTENRARAGLDDLLDK